MIKFKQEIMNLIGLPCRLSSKESACQCRRYRRHRFNPRPGRSPGEGKGNPLQYSCLGNPLDRGAWWATVHGVTKSQTQLSNKTTTTINLRATLELVGDSVTHLGVKNWGENQRFEINSLNQPS